MIGSKEGIMRSEQQKHGHNKGFTLIELLVSMGIFSIILTIGVGAFVIALNAQRTASAQQAVASNARFALEFMSRQMRVAKEDQAAVCVDGSSGTFFEVASAPADDVIRFMNAQNTCVRFFLSGGAIITDLTGSDAAITDSTSVTIENLQFILLDDIDTQPRLTIVIRVRGVGSEQAESATMTVQTTISPREIEI